MKKTYEIAVIPGDGTGPEVVAEGIKVLEAVAAQFEFGYHFCTFDIAGDHYLATGETITDQTLEAFSVITSYSIHYTKLYELWISVWH